jgi:hypothetical protein
MAVLLTSLTGCPARPEPSVAPPQVEAPPVAEAVQAIDPRSSVRITPTLGPTPRVHVAIEIDGPPEPDESLRRWSIAGPLAEPLEVRVRDAVGEIAGVIVELGDGAQLTLERPPSLPLRLEYELAPVSPALGSLARVELDEQHFFATGEALLLLPDDALERRSTLHVSVEADAFTPEQPDLLTGLPPLRAASSFAAGPEFEGPGWPFELRRAAFVAGSLEWAEFDSIRGSDRYLGIGPTRFDHRWSAAELASVRSAIDSRIAVPTFNPWVTIVLGAGRSAAEPPLSVELRGRGLVIVADHSALWDTSARMLGAQALAARWLGGRVRVLEADAKQFVNERALWFDAGATRFVAREILYEFGLLADEDYAAELNAIELELAASPVRGHSLEELAAAIASGEAPDARASLAARGAMFMAWLDAEIRAHPGEWNHDGVIEVLRIAVATTIAREQRGLTVAELLRMAAEKISLENPHSAPLLAGFEQVIVHGRRPTLGPDTFGPCFRPRTRKLRRFELGFIDRSHDEHPSFTALDPTGPAAQAGLRADDSLISLDYIPGEPEQIVTIRFAREGATKTIRYRPSGPPHTVVWWERDARVPPESCVR